MPCGARKTIGVRCETSCEHPDVPQQGGSVRRTAREKPELWGRQLVPTHSHHCLMWECDITVTDDVNQSNVMNICINYCLILTP
jgi:hypothetical protein